MKTLSTILLLFAVCVASHSQSSELKYNLEKGKTYRVKSVTTQDQTMTVQGMERKTETISTSCFSIKMLDSKPDFFLAEVKFDTIKTKVSMPPMDLNSAEKGDIHSQDPVEVTKCILNRLSNSTIVAKLAYTGHVQDIMNHAMIEKTVLQGVDSLKGQVAMAKGQLESLVDKESLIGMIEGVTAHLPNKKVKKGDKWESSFVSHSGGVGMAFSSNLLLDEISKSNATISGDIIVEPASTEPTMMNGAEITNELRGLGKSTVEVDPNTGWLISANSKIQLSGNMQVKAPGQDMTIPIETQISSETVAIE